MGSPYCALLKNSFNNHHITVMSQNPSCNSSSDVLSHHSFILYYHVVLLLINALTYQSKHHLSTIDLNHLAYQIRRLI